MTTETVNFTIRYDAGNLAGLDIPQTVTVPNHEEALRYVRFYEGVRFTNDSIRAVDTGHKYRIIGPVTITEARRLVSSPCGTGAHGGCFGNLCPCNCHRDDRDGCTCALSDEGLREHGHMTACPRSAAAWRIAERDAATKARGGIAWGAPAQPGEFS